MRVVHLPCGTFVNASEERAFKAVDTYLRHIEGEGQAFVLTNLSHAAGRGQPEEIDQVVIGPGGAVVIEVKHWDRARLRDVWDVDPQCTAIIGKAKRVAGRLRPAEPQIGFVPPAMLLTRDQQSLRRNGQLPERPGVVFYGLKDLDILLAPVVRGALPDSSVERLARMLAPREAAIVSAVPRRLARFDNLKLLSPAEDRFARVYSGRDPAMGDRVIIHSYDLSAAPSAATNAERVARREFDAVQRLQKSPYLPSLVDSWQAVPNYAGELYFFTLADPAATALADLARDDTWGRADRLAFAARALRALAELQSPTGPQGEVVLHRSLNPGTVRVRADGAPLFAGWRWARLPQAQTIVGLGLDNECDAFAAPEVQSGGLSAAGPASDTYSLCKTLMEAAHGDGTERELLEAALSLGLDPDTKLRAAPAAIAEQLNVTTTPAEIETSASAIESVPVTPQRWDEGFVFLWERQKFRVVSLLGQGGVGRTFKLEQLDPVTGDPIGTYVGKVALDSEVGPAALNAYRKIRSIADHPCLSSVLLAAAEWSPETLLALLRWRRGEPLDAWRGADLAVLAEYAGEPDVETMVLRWATDLCEALDILHAQGWVHGDVSPGNILVDDGSVMLIDFDLAGPLGTVAKTPGTLPYASPSRRSHAPAQPTDDLFSFAATLFHVVTDRRPFDDGVVGGGLPWAEGERERWPRLAPFLDAAVDQDPSRRFDAGASALRFLRARVVSEESVPEAEERSLRLRPNVVPRVRDILQTYPGSRFGNSETRGLDSEFAHDTYVETRLDARLRDAVTLGEVNLVVLCGNAGDGKTAFLQHLAAALGVPRLPSSDRVWTGRLGDRYVVINLDGAASWKGRSADELLDELFEPFQAGPPRDARVHLVAVNDGRLLEWIESYEARHGGQETTLTAALAEALGRDGAELPSYVRLIELNLRSLVGGIDLDQRQVTTDFIDRLVARLVGGDAATDIWLPCRACTAQARCQMRQSAQMMGASRDPEVLARGALFRRRLTTALQAVHQRNDVHITARELKAAISYILFGLYDCEDLHKDPGLAPHVPWDHAFDPASPLRQGELLRELVRLDPGLDVHARFDRYLAGQGAPAPDHGAPRYPGMPIRRARRRAFFEWTDAQIEAVVRERDALGLRDGHHLAAFRDFPLMAAERQAEIRDALCRGLSRLESLPDIAYRRLGVTPVRIVPRTPTETAFWVEKPLDQFTLEAERFATADGLETLHRYLTLGYRAADGRVERLTVSLELYTLLMNLANGMQILDAFSDDVFANLNVFTERLAQEDERHLRVWNPADEGHVYAVGIEPREQGQIIVLQVDEAA